MKKIVIYILYWIWSLTWGILITLVGIVAACGLMISGHKPRVFNPNIYFTVGKDWGGVNFGPIFITSKTDFDYVKYHESGHGLQNLIWGPLFPFVIAIPSAIRYWYRELKYYRKGLTPKTDYDSIWFEGQATRWGNKVYNRKENN